MYGNYGPESILLIVSLLLFISILAGKAGSRFGVPALLLFLGVGMLVGSDGLGIHFDNPDMAQFIGLMALSIILFSGGMDTKMSEIRPIMAQGVILATLGVLLTTVITGLFIYYIISTFFYNYISLTIPECMLLASVMSSTDSASVFSILRSKGLKLKHNLRPTLELESGSNDPMAYMLTLVFISIVKIGEFDLASSLQLLLMQFSIGLIAGYLLGLLTVYIINRINIDNHSLYPILLFAFVFFIFSFTDMLNGNGYLAVYIAGVVIGNKKIIHKKSISTFFDGFAWLWQIIMFLSLGLLVNPTDLVTPSVAGIGLLTGIFMILASRPASVFICLLPFRKVTFKSRLYISWVGLRGAVPIIFATYPLVEGVQHAGFIFNVVFFITILSLLTQGTSVPSMAKLLHLSEEEKAAPEMLGIELPEEIKSAMSEIEVIPSVLSNGNKLMNLSLPDNTLVVMIKRKDKYFIPKGNTVLLEGDKLLVISDNEHELYQTYRELGITDYSTKKN
jgi:cell volume regulation protein A